MTTAISPIAFNRPYMPPQFLDNVNEIFFSLKTKGDGEFSSRCSALISEMSGGGTVLLTPSCTHALEMSTQLLGLKAEDEVILPSFTFTSAAVALSNYRVKPVFVDIDPLSKNIDPKRIREAITDKTKAISVVNYAGISASYSEIQGIADEFGLKIIEDNAHGLLGEANGRPLGSFGVVASLSFHESKNFQCGEGGALIINDPQLVEHAEVLREKGTNRNRFLRGQIDKYTWIGGGSSQLLSEVSAALLLPQLEMAQSINASRLSSWNFYFQNLDDWAKLNGFGMPFNRVGFKHTAHIFYLMAPDIAIRDRFVAHLDSFSIPALFHYQALHSSPAGLQFGRLGNQTLSVSESVSSRLLRLPLYFDMPKSVLERVVNAIKSFES
jgi:dTDP-4-amino-4,6-dideoxygalactose transaminase